MSADRKRDDKNSGEQSPVTELTLLIVDDDDATREVLARYLSRDSSWTVETAESAREAIDFVQAGVGDIIISDVYMPEMDGIELVNNLRSMNPDIEVIITTGFSDEELAIKALKAGAFDYFQKPLNPNDLLASLQRTRRYRELRLENQRLKAILARSTRVDEQHSFIGESKAALDLKEKLERISSSSNATVLLTGESGVGKEVAARYIHRLSRPSSAPFIAVNCGAIAPTLLEAELFGRERVAFTVADKTVPGVFEMAIGGSVLLDEISEMSYEAQSRFLRVLEDRRIRRIGGTKEISVGDLRIIAATNKDLEVLIEDGSFRHDLYYRIMVAPIQIPALRERCDDILPLAQYFLDGHAQESGRKLRFSKQAETMLGKQEFPGNIRQLRNMIERAMIFSRGPEIGPGDLGISPGTVSRDGVEAISERADKLDSEIIELSDLEQIEICKALETYDFNHTAAATALGISVQALYRKIKKYNIQKS